MTSPQGQKKLVAEVAEGARKKERLEKQEKLETLEKLERGTQRTQRKTENCAPRMNLDDHPDALNVLIGAYLMKMLLAGDEQ